jgi:hypothetical protein
VRALYKLLGESTLISVLHIGRPVLHRLLQGFAVSKETETRVWMALSEYEYRERARAESAPPPPKRAVVVTMETSPKASLSRLEATRLFKEKIWDRASTIDPDDDHKWESMALGFFIALGFEPTDAKSLAYLVIDSDFYEK